MFAFQREARQRPMVEILFIQPRERKFLAIVLQMTTSAIDFRRGNVVGLGVIASVRFDAPLNFGVAFQAFQPPVAGPEVMAARALRHPLQLLMGTREGARGDLGGGDAARPDYGRHGSQRFQNPSHPTSKDRQSMPDH